MKRVIALALMLLGAAPALGDEFVCTGDLIYNPYNNAFMVQDAKGPFRSMIRITKVDTATGRYTQHWFNTPDAVLAEGTLTVVSEGSVEEIRDFVGVDVESGLLLRVSLASKINQFMRVDPEGAVQIGGCVKAGG
jgi:hypothetical protein